MSHNLQGSRDSGEFNLASSRGTSGHTRGAVLAAAACWREILLQRRGEPPPAQAPSYNSQWVTPEPG